MVVDYFVKCLKEILIVIAVFLLGCSSIIFFVLYFEVSEVANLQIYVSVCVAMVSICAIFSVAFFRKNGGIFFKLFFLVSLAVCLLWGIIYAFKVTGFNKKIASINDFRDYVSSFGSNAVFLFICLQFMQVIVLPLPSFVAVGAGVLSFGPFRGALYSSIGIISGSLVAFWFARVFGVKVVAWLVGRDNLRKGLRLIEGRDKLIFTFMFLFPFFPDDLLCFVAGLTSLNATFFCVMIVIVRLITIFMSSYSFSNSLIPYDTWWGLLLWLAFFVGVVVASVKILKKKPKTCSMRQNIDKI